MPKTEEGNPPEAQPASRNLVVMEEEFSSFELTRSNSDVASSLSAENSGDILHPSVNGRLGNCTAWTDDMHNKFLDSLEASFVQQLHQSRDLLAWCKEHNSGDKDAPRRLPISLNKASEQFSHLRDDGWKNLIFEKDQHVSYIAAIEIPWMHCQGLAAKVSPLPSADPKECNEFYHGEEHLKGKRSISNEPENLEQDPCKSPCYHNPVGSIKEGSGQNFVDGNCEDSSNVFPLAKRLKKAVKDT